MGQIRKKNYIAYFGLCGFIGTPCSTVYRVCTVQENVPQDCKVLCMLRNDLLYQHKYTGGGNHYLNVYN